MGQISWFVSTRMHFTTHFPSNWNIPDSAVKVHEGFLEAYVHSPRPFLS
jgi:hypothetical protein